MSDSAVRQIRPAKTVDLPGMTLRSYVLPSGSGIPGHREAETSEIMVLDGGYREKIGHAQRWCKRGETTVMPQGVFHSERVGRSGTKCLIASLSCPLVDRIRVVSPVLNSPSYFRSIKTQELTREIRREFEMGNQFSSLSLEGLVLELVAELGRSQDGLCLKPPWLKDVLELLYEHYSETLTLFQVAAEVGISRSHLARSFRRCVGHSVGSYLRRIRLHRATEQLRSSGHSLVMIAQNCGFYDQSHFSHAFKRHFGTTPQRFRWHYSKTR